MKTPRPQQALHTNNHFQKGAHYYETRYKFFGSLCNCNQFGVFVATALTAFLVCAPCAVVDGLPWTVSTRTTSCGERAAPFPIVEQEAEQRRNHAPFLCAEIKTEATMYRASLSFVSGRGGSLLAKPP